MTEKPNYRMGAGEKLFLWGFGIVVALVLVVAIPALISQRARARAKANEASVQPSTPPQVPPPAPAPQANSEPPSSTPGGPDANDHREELSGESLKQAAQDEAERKKREQEVELSKQRQELSALEASILAEQERHKQTPFVSPNLLHEILPKPDLIYPAVARAGRIQGIVRVALTISSEGTPTNAVAIDGPPMLQKYAEEWQMKRRFQPPVVDGKAQAVNVIMTINYSLKN